MSWYRKPTKLLPLNLYSPYQCYSTNHSLISRDQKRIINRFHGDSESFSKTQQPVIDTCIRSFNWMYRSPVCRNTSYHLEQSLGKARRVKLKPLSNRNSVSTESPKKYLTRKPTINLRKSLILNTFPTELSEHALHGTLKLTSACIEVDNLNFFIPLNHLKNVIFAPQSEVEYNVSQCIRTGTWNLVNELYSNFEDVSLDYSASIYLPSMQLTVFLVKSKVIYSRNLGKLVGKFEKKGLVMKYCRMIELNGPCLVMAWQGCESHSVSLKFLAGFPEDYYEITSWEKVKKLLPKSGNALIPDLVEKLSFRCNSKYIKFTFPYLTYEDSHQIPIPLGTLKEMINSDFTNWAEIWIKRNEESFPHRRSGLDNSSLKSSLCIKDEPCVLTMNSYEIHISNSEIEASFAFKLGDMELILTHSGSELVNHLAKSAKIMSFENKGKLYWDLMIDIENIPSSKGEIPKESQIFIQGKEFKCKFVFPRFELYKPHTGEASVKVIRPEDLIAICKEKFKKWEEVGISYFNE